jgi:DNA invertase Pin-like site-specific DNA recombinase
MKSAAIYTRFSPRPGANECLSNEKQEERCRAYCQNRGYEVVAVYADDAVTGGVFERPGLAAAIERLVSMEGDRVLVVDSVDRLARDMLVNLTIRHEVERAGGKLEFANGTTATETPEGRLFSHILFSQPLPLTREIALDLPQAGGSNVGRQMASSSGARP